AAAALAGAAAALGVRALVTGPSAAPPMTPHDLPVLSTPAPPSLGALLLRSTDGSTLNVAAFHLIRAGEYAQARPFARRAARYAAPSSLTRAYATFNLGYALLELGRCDEALPLLTKALRLESPEQRPYISPRIAAAKRCAASGPARSQSAVARTVPSPAP